MNRLWQILSAILGAFSVLFYALNKSKDRKIEKYKDESKRHESEAKQERFKGDAERKTKHDLDDIRGASESSTNSMLDKQGALRDGDERS